MRINITSVIQSQPDRINMNSLFRGRLNVADSYFQQVYVAFKHQTFMHQLFFLSFCFPSTFIPLRFNAELTYFVTLVALKILFYLTAKTFFLCALLPPIHSCRPGSSVSLCVGRVQKQLFNKADVSASRPPTVLVTPHPSVCRWLLNSRLQIQKQVCVSMLSAGVSGRKHLSVGGEKKKKQRCCRVQWVPAPGSSFYPDSTEQPVLRKPKNLRLGRFTNMRWMNV